MPPQAVDREEAGGYQVSRPGPCGGRCHPSPLKDPERRRGKTFHPVCASANTRILVQTRLDSRRSSPAQPERLGVRSAAGGIAPPPCRAAALFPHARPPPARAPPIHPPHHPGARRASAATRGRWRPPRAYLRRAGEQRQPWARRPPTPGATCSPRGGPSTPPASGPRERVNFCSALLLEIC